MEQILEILKLVLPALLGGGLSWIFMYRVKKTELENQVFVQEYKDISKIIEDFNARNAALTSEMSSLRNLILDKDQLIGQLKNRITNECTCEIKESVGSLLP